MDWENDYRDDKEWIAEWNQLHCVTAAIAPSSDFRNRVMALYCEVAMLRAKELYYKTEKTIMSDKQYDRLEDCLVSLNPDSEVLKMVGTK